MTFVRPRHLINSLVSNNVVDNNNRVAHYLYTTNVYFCNMYHICEFNYSHTTLQLFTIYALSFVSYCVQLSMGWSLLIYHRYWCFTRYDQIPFTSDENEFLLFYSKININAKLDLYVLQG